MSKATREKFNLPPLNILKPAPAAPPAMRVVHEGQHGPGSAWDGPPAGAVWNGIRHLWMADGEPVDPQPPAPLRVSFSLDSGRHVSPVLPAVKVEV